MEPPIPFPKYEKILLIMNIGAFLLGLISFLPKQILDKFCQPFIYLPIALLSICCTGFVFADFMRNQRWNNLAVSYDSDSTQTKNMLLKGIRYEFWGDFSLFVGIRLSALATYLGKVFEYNRDIMVGSQLTVILYLLMGFLVFGFILILCSTFLLSASLAKYPKVTHFHRKPAMASYLALAAIAVAGGEDLISKIVLLLWISALFNIQTSKNQSHREKLREKGKTPITTLKKLFALKQEMEKNYYSEMNSAENVWQVILISMPALYFGPIFILFFNDSLNLSLNLALLASLFILYFLKRKRGKIPRSCRFILFFGNLLIILFLHGLIFYFEKHLDPSLLYNNFQDTGLIAIGISIIMFLLIMIYNWLVLSVKEQHDYLKFLMKFGDVLTLIITFLMMGAGFAITKMLDIPVIYVIFGVIIVWALVEEVCTQYYVKLAVNFMENKKIQPNPCIRSGYYWISYLSLRTRIKWNRIMKKKSTHKKE